MLSSERRSPASGGIAPIKSRKNQGQANTSVGPIVFTVILVLFGVGMGIGKAAVYKYIPEYFPRDVGAVGGVVGALGGLGGFFLPPLFAWCQALTGMPQATFAVLLGVILASFVWLHMTVLAQRRAQEAPADHSASERPALLAQS